MINEQGITVFDTQKKGVEYRTSYDELKRIHAVIGASAFHAIMQLGGEYAKAHPLAVEAVRTNYPKPTQDSQEGTLTIARQMDEAMKAENWNLLSELKDKKKRLEGKLFSS